jgi:hypothetical protein
VLLAFVLVAIYAVHSLLSLWAHLQVRRFVTQTPTIADQACLDRYKGLVRVQMYFALSAIVLLGTGGIVALLLVKQYGYFGLVLVLAGSVCIIAGSLVMRRWEVRARTLPAGSEALAEEYRKVSHAWVKKPLPDF